MASSSCWELFGWGAGCHWGKAETTAMDKGWSVQHEAYNVFEDFSGDVVISGNDCDGTVLKCKGSHSSYTLPSRSLINCGWT
jgi:hypothetical protein